MPFCPNCCFYFGENDEDTCPKCDADVQSIRDEIARRQTPKREPSIIVPVGNNRVVQKVYEGPIQDAMKCPLCSEVMGRHPDDCYSIDLLGGEVNVMAVAAMNMTIRKKAITHMVLDFEGWLCPNGHMYYTNLRKSIREICPECRDTLSRFGSTVLTCKRCRINITKDRFIYMEADQIMEENGWHKLT